MSAQRDRAWLEAHLPHQGGMNLLDRVESWTAESIRCVATGHRSDAHPLRHRGTLPAVAAIEYGAQAAAAHGAILGGEGGKAQPGVLASIREVDLLVDRLDGLDADLLVEAERVATGAGGTLYAFRVEAGGMPIARGRVTIVFGTPPAATSP